MATALEEGRPQAYDRMLADLVQLLMLIGTAIKLARAAPGWYFIARIESESKSFLRHGREKMNTINP